MVNSALPSIPHLARGAVPRIRAPVLSPPAFPAKKAWRCHACHRAGLRSAKGEGALAPAAAAGASAGAGKRGYPGCGTPPGFLSRASDDPRGRGNTTMHCLLSPGPGTQYRVGAGTETLERRGGAMRGGGVGGGGGGGAPSLRTAPPLSRLPRIAGFPRPPHISPLGRGQRLTRNSPSEKVPGATTPFLAEIKCSP